MPRATTTTAEMTELRVPSQPDNDTEAAALTSAREPSRSRAGLRSRVLLWFLGYVVLALVATVVVIRASLQRELQADIGRALSQEVSEFETATKRLSAEGRAADAQSLLLAYLDTNAVPEDEVIVAMVDGAPIARSAGSTFAVDELRSVRDLATVGRSESGEMDTPLGPLRYVAVPVIVEPDDSGVLFIGAYLGPRTSRMNATIGRVIGAALGLFGLAAVGAWSAASGSLRPLRRLLSAMRDIDEQSMSRRLILSGGGEIAELADQHNRMLDRIETAFTSQRQFLDDVAHELGTPMTIIRGSLGTLPDPPSSAEMKAAQEIGLDELGRMDRIVGDLLTLARAQRPDFIRLSPVDLADFTEALVMRANQVGERPWRIDALGVAVVEIDEQRLGQAVANLVRNALSYTTDGELAIGSECTPTSTRIWVRDQGPGIDSGEQARLFDRFERGSEAKPGTGSGLGLAIVSAIVEAHGGTVGVHSVIGHGTTFTIELPSTHRA